MLLTQWSSVRRRFSSDRPGNKLSIRPVLSGALVGAFIGALASGCGGGSDPAPLDGGAPGNDAAVDAGGSACISAAPGELVRVREPLDFFGNDLYQPEAAINDQGTGVVTWGEEIGDTNIAQAVALEDGCWGEPVRLGYAGALGETAVVDAAGRATVIWTQRELGDDGLGIEASSLWAMRYQDGAWQPGERISDDPPRDYSSYVLDPVVHPSGDGEVIAVWLQRGDGFDRVFWNRFDGSAWGTPAVLTAERIASSQLRIAAAGDGALVVTWTESSDVYTEDHYTALYAARWDGSAWDEPQYIGLPDLQNNDGIDRLRLTGRGEAGASAIWEQYAAGVRTFQQAHYDAATQSWQAPSAVPPIVDSAQFVSLAGSASGAMSAAWQVPEPLGEDEVDNVWGARFDPDSGWSEAVRLELDDAPADDTSVGMDAQGRALATWVQLRPGEQVFPRVWASTATGATWSAASELASASGTRPVVAVSPGGHALMVLGTQEAAQTTFLHSVGTVYLPPGTW